MQIRLSSGGARILKIVSVTAGSVLLAAVFFYPLMRVAGLVFGGAALAFFVEPVDRLFEKQFPRPVAALIALVFTFGILAAVLWLTLPALTRDIGQFASALPESVNQLSIWADGAGETLRAHVPGLPLPTVPWDRVNDALSGLAARAVSAAQNAADTASRFSMMLVLGYFFLCDRDSLLLRLELLVPQAARATAVRMGRAVLWELRLYLRGQLTVAGIVGLLSALGMVTIGVRSALVLGVTCGIFNMVPYFGPFIGGVPAVLIALGDGWRKAALCAGVLALVQQLDSAVISPRIMGSFTGFSPAAVLVAIYAGASLAGIGGMLIALPVIMSIRTVFRVFVQRYENI